MKKLLPFLLFIACPQMYGQLTTVTDTLHKADGSTCSGTFKVSWQSYYNSANQPVMAGSRTVQVTSGLFTVALYPQMYSVIYDLALTQCVPAFQNWLVPFVGPVGLAGVTSLNASSPIPLAWLAQEGATVGQAMCWLATGTWGPGTCGGGGGGTGGLPPNGQNGNCLTYANNVPTWLPCPIGGSVYASFTSQSTWTFLGTQHLQGCGVIPQVYDPAGNEMPVPGVFRNPNNCDITVSFNNPTSGTLVVTGQGNGNSTTTSLCTLPCIVPQTLHRQASTALQTAFYDIFGNLVHPSVYRDPTSLAVTFSGTGSGLWVIGGLSGGTGGGSGSGGGGGTNPFPSSGKVVASNLNGQPIDAVNGTQCAVGSASTGTDAFLNPLSCIPVGGSTSGALLVSNNLSEIASSGSVAQNVARVNLGLNVAQPHVTACVDVSDTCTQLNAVMTALQNAGILLPTTLGNGLAVALPMTEASGTPRKDLISGYSFVETGGTVSTTLGQSRITSAFFQSTGSSKLVASSTAAMNPSGAFSVCAIAANNFSTGNVGTTKTVAQKGKSWILYRNIYSYTFSVTSGGTVVSVTAPFTPGPTTGSVNDSGSRYDLVCGIWDGSSTISINQNLQSATQTGVTSIDSDPSIAAAIGGPSSANFSATFYKGAIATILFWNRALTSTEQTTLFNGGIMQAATLDTQPLVNWNKYVFSNADYWNDGTNIYSGKIMAHTTGSSVRFTTNAPAIAIFLTGHYSADINQTLDYPILVKVNGSYYTAQNPYQASLLNYTTTDTVLVPLPSGTNTVEVITSSQVSAPGDIANDQFTAVAVAPGYTISKIAPTMTNGLLVFGASIDGGHGGTIAVRDGFQFQLRDSGLYPGNIETLQYGGRILYTDCNSSSTCQALVTNQFATFMAPTNVLLADFGYLDSLNSTAVTNFTTNANYLLADLHTLWPSAHIWVSTPALSTVYEGASMDSIRSQGTAACNAVSSYCTPIDGTQIQVLGHQVDGAHPNNIGYQNYCTYIVQQILGNNTLTCPTPHPQTY